jgi:hypothetical protein
VKVSERTIKRLAEIITGDVDLSPYPNEATSRGCLADAQSIRDLVSFRFHLFVRHFGVTSTSRFPANSTGKCALCPETAPNCFPLT